MHKHETYLISGDKKGGVGVRDISANYEKVGGDIVTSKNAWITCAIIANPKNKPTIFVGDAYGCITAITYDNNKNAL
jgi:hypothetical protein